MTRTRNARHELRKTRTSSEMGEAAGPRLEVRRAASGASVLVESNPAPGGDPYAPVAVELWIAAGAADEGPELFGAAHLLEHMVFKPRTSGAPDLAARLEAMGGDVNAFTAYDETVYHVVVPAQAAIEAACVLLAGVLHPRLAASDLATERDVVIEELRLSLDDPEQQFHEALWRRTFAGTPYGHAILGTLASVRGITAAALRRFHRRTYVGGRTQLVVVGPVEPEAVFAAAVPVLGSIPAGRPRAYARRRGAGREPAGRGRVQQRGEVTEDHVAIAYRVASRDVEDHVAWELAAEILGGGDTGILHRRIVRAEGIASSAHVAYYPGRLASTVLVSATARPGRGRALEAALVEALQGPDEEGVSRAAIGRVRASAWSGEAFRRETVQGRAQAYGSAWILHGDPGVARARPGIIESMPAGRVEAAIRELAVRIPGGAVIGRLAARGAEGPRPRARSRRAAKRFPGRPTPAGTYHRVLDNGIRLLVRPIENPSLVAGVVALPGGRMLEPPEQAGVAALAARCLTLGTEAMDETSLAEAVALRGAYLDGFSSRTVTGLSFEAPASELPDVLELVEECLAAPRFDVDVVADERRLQIDELRSMGDDPQWIAVQRALARLYGSHPFGRDRLGTISSVRRLGADEVDGYWTRVQRRAPVVALVGDVDPARILERVCEWAGGRPAQLPRWPRPRPPRRPLQTRLHRDRKQVYAAVAFSGPAVDAPDAEALEVACAVLGGQGGLLFQALREREGLVYHVSLSPYLTALGGHVVLKAATTPDKVARTLEIAAECIERIRAGAIPDAMVEAAKRHLRGRHAGACERRSQVAAALAFGALRRRPVDDFEALPARIGAVSLHDMVAAARRYLVPEQAVTSLVGPLR